MLPMMKEESSVGVDTLLQSKGVDMRRQEARYKQHISQGDLFGKEEMQKAIYQDTQLGLLDTSE